MSDNWILRHTTQYRRRRFSFFLSLIKTVRRPLNILDVGGTELYWQQTGLFNVYDIHITLLNREPTTGYTPQFSAVIGDACKMTEFTDDAFDVVFSNSVIEHVGDYFAQLQMASEVQRVGKAFFVQTPNRGFPLEPHFFVPFMHWLPLEMRLFMARHFALKVGAGWLQRRTPDVELMREVTETRLLSRAELARLFPGAKIWTERLFGISKSFIAYGGWEKINKCVCG